MTCEEILALLNRAARAKADTLRDVPDTRADLIITGPSSCVIGAEVRNGILSVQPVSTGSPEATVTLSGDDFAALVTGKLNPMAAVFSGRIKVTGNYAKLMSIVKLIKK